jgi:hypothetical protein
MELTAARDVFPTRTVARCDEIKTVMQRVIQTHFLNTDSEAGHVWTRMYEII